MDTPGQAVPIIGIMVPIVAIVFGIGIGMLWIYLDFRRKRELYQLYHAERMAAIEKGMELPPLPTDLFEKRGRGAAAGVRSRRWGLILLFFGVAISVAMWGSGEDRNDWWWGLVPVSLGLSLLISSHFEAKEKASATSAADAGRNSTNLPSL